MLSFVRSYTPPAAAAVGAGTGVLRWMLGVGDITEVRLDGNGLGDDAGGNIVSAGDTLWYDETLSTMNGCH